MLRETTDPWFRMARVAAYLRGEVGGDRPVLMEKPRLGRTEGFAEVIFGEDRTAGEIVRARISGVAGERLIA